MIDIQNDLRRQLEILAPDAALTYGLDGYFGFYSKLLRHYAVACRVPTDRIEDLIQTVWAEVIARLPKFQCDEHGAGLRAWLYNLVHSTAVDEMRRQRRHPTTPLRPEHTEQTSSGPVDDPVSRLEKSWRRELVRTVVAELKDEVGEENHRILMLRYYDDRPVHDIAKTMGMTSNQVKQRLKRMLQRLRTHFAGYTAQDFADE